MEIPESDALLVSKLIKAANMNIKTAVSQRVPFLLPLI